MRLSTSAAGKCFILVVLVCGNAATGAAQELVRVMTFNVWTGEDTTAGRAKLVEIMQTAGADIIGVQELAAAHLSLIADALGFHAYQQSGNDIQVLSRYPIVESSPAGLGVRIEVSPQQDVWMFNAHLAAYPYQPYDLRDGILPQSEAAVIAAANAARGGQVAQYLSDIAAVGALGGPVFFTGDFNEPSHLDWTAAAAAATERPFDLEVAYPASSRITEAGFVDAFRTVRPDEVNDPGYTWTPGYPPPMTSPNEVHDRIDFIYYRGAGVTATGAFTIGYDSTDPSTDVAVPGYNSDHLAVVADFGIPACTLWGDLTGDCRLDFDDWAAFRSGQHTDLRGLTYAEAYARGDMNGDFVNEHADFVLFKRAFNAANGPRAFEALSTGVPEPDSLALAAIALAAGVVGAPRRTVR